MCDITSQVCEKKCKQMDDVHINIQSQCKSDLSNFTNFLYNSRIIFRNSTLWFDNKTTETGGNSGYGTLLRRA